jgi:hypothetical protein
MPTLHSTKILGDLRVTGLTNLNELGAVTLIGQLTSTVATGTAPFVIASTTRVANLNVATAGTADASTQIATTQKSDNVAYNIPFVSGFAAGNKDLFTDTEASITYNPSTNLLTLAGNISLTGASSVSTSTGNLTLSSSAANGNIVLSPHGTGGVTVASATTTGSALDVSLTAAATTGDAAKFSTAVNYIGSTTSGIVDIITSSTARADGSFVLFVNSQGTNGTTARHVKGARISVTNTNATSGTNTALELNAASAPTDNIALSVIAGRTALQALDATTGTFSSRISTAQNMTAGTTAAFTNPHLALKASNTTDNTGFVGMTFDTSTTANYGFSFGALRSTNGSGSLVTRFHDASAAGTEVFSIGPTGNLVTPGNLAVNGGNITTSATTLTIGNTATTAQTLNLGTAATAASTIKALNIGTGGAAGSTTNINIGSSVAGTTTISSPTVSIPGNLTVAGNITVNNVEMINTSNGIIFEGSTNDDFETTLIAVDPTVGDQVYQLPNFAAAGTWTLSTVTGTETLTNKTLTAPRITSGSHIADSNGNELINFPAAVTSAVNELYVSNAATGNAVGISTTGNDTNIGLNITTKGTGTMYLDSGAAGAVNIGTSANAKTVTIGNVTGASGVTLNTGTAGITASSTATTGSAMSLTANSVTSGNGLLIQSTGAGTMVGSLLNVIGNGAITTGDLAKFSSTGYVGSTSSGLVDIISSSTARATNSSLLFVNSTGNVNSVITKGAYISAANAGTGATSIALQLNATGTTARAIDVVAGTSVLQAMTATTGAFSSTLSATTLTLSSTSPTLTTTASGAKTANFISNTINATATSSTASVTKTGLEIQSTGTWNGGSAINRSLFLNATGGTINRAIEVVSGDSVFQALSATTGTFSSTLSATTLTSTVASGTAPLSVASTTKVANLNADLFDDMDSVRFVFGQNGSGSTSAPVNWEQSHVTQYKSGFWDINGASWSPTTDWWWGMTLSHVSNTASYLYGAQMVFSNSLTPEFKYRGMNGGASGATGSWKTVINVEDTQSITGAKTFTAPRIASGSHIADSNGNELINFPTAVTSAVNELYVSNAATGNAVQLSTTGGDTNIGLNVTTKGTGTMYLDSGTTGLVNIGTGASAKTVTVGNTTTTSTLALRSGTGGASILTGTTGTVSIDSGTSGAISIGTNANAKTITLGNVTGTTGITLNTGTAGIIASSTATTGNAFSLTANSVTSGKGLNIATGGTGKTVSLTAASISATATSSTASIIKTGLEILSTGGWSGTLATNRALYINATGGTNNYAAIFENGLVGIGQITPTSALHIKNTTPEIKLEAGSTTDSGTMRYNSTTKSIEFIFV